MSNRKTEVRYAQLIDGERQRMRFKQDKRDRIDAITAAIGKPPLQWERVLVDAETYEDVS